MFKINNINGEYLDITDSPTKVLGVAVHKALQAYVGGVPEEVTPADEGESIKFGYEYGKKWLDQRHDGLIDYNTVIENRAELEEKYSTTYFGYVKELNLEKRMSKFIMAEQMLTHHASVEGQYMPIPFKGSADLVFKDKKKHLIIWDHKIVSSYSKEDEVDGAKLIQAGILYHLHKAELKEEPYSCIFAEYKVTKNKDGSPQLRLYEFVYKESPLIFDLLYRYYYDVTRALLGEQVFVPNLTAMYDREVSILAYINYLDVDEEREKAFKKAKVKNITDFLKKKIQKDSTMKRYINTVTSKFISAETLNYKDMTTEDKIKMKLAEHGIAVEFKDKVTGNTVEMYRFEPSIGVKMSRIDDYVRDLEQVTSTSGMRVLAPIPGSDLVGFELPLQERTFPTTIPPTDGFNLAFGQDIFGKDFRMDIRQAPHLLVSGATLQGKSKFLDVLITQLKKIPTVDLVLLDPKMVELNKWKSSGEYYEQPEDIAKCLIGLVEEMNDRYKKLQKLGKRNVEGTNMRYKFVVIDEYGDLALSKDKIVTGTKKVQKLYATGEREMEVETEEKVGEVAATCVKKLAQKARAAGIHIVLTTQRPSVKILDGDIKANFPTRIAFRTSTSTDSQVILDQGGAEKLLGKGDMLVSTSEGVIRLQGYNI